jgi:hypothetical protein
MPNADLQLDGVEFSSLPSGLHLVEEDVVYVNYLSLTFPCTLASTSLGQVLHEERSARGVHLYPARDT